MKYPRYAREQKLSVKLSHADIKFIRNFYQHGIVGRGCTVLAKMFSVHKNCILYWVDDEYRKRTNKASVNNTKIWRLLYGRNQNEGKRYYERKKIASPGVLRYQCIRAGEYNKTPLGVIRHRVNQKIYMMRKRKNNSLNRKS